MTSVLVVFNAGSGKADEDTDRAILEGLSDLGSVEAVRPRHPDSFDSEVRAAASRADVVVSAGGDGTLNMTINALAERLDELVFGVAPMGTGNDFARTLGWPLDPVEAAHAMAGADTRAIDVARASGAGVRRLFVNACMGGFPVKMNEAIDADVKKRLGPLAFLVGGVKALRDLEHSTVVVNGTSVVDCVAVGVGNGRTSGGGIELWPSAQPDDGVLDACALTADSLPRAILAAGKVRIGAHEGADEALLTADRRIEVDADPQLEFNVDGELLGLLTPATFELVARTRFLAPVSTRDPGSRTDRGGLGTSSSR